MMTDKMHRQPSTKSRPGTASPPARPFQCQWHEGCPKSFNRKSDLQRHYRIHTNERPYACDYKPCDKTFIQRSALTVHRRTHTGDKPHKCPFVGCGKCFSDSSSLARHRRIHTNDKPYICKNPQCRKAFCRKTTMTKHFRKEHPTDSIDQEEDADYSDVDPSDDDFSLEHDVDSPSSADFSFDPHFKSNASGNPAASNYNANLWRLPAQTAQRPAHQALKLQRSHSRSPSRSLTDPIMNGPVPSNGFIPRSNTIPNEIPRSHSTDMAMWQGQQVDQSPSNLSPEGVYPMSGMNTPTSIPTHMQQTPLRRQSLQQSVHDIILDDPTCPIYPQQPAQPLNGIQTSMGVPPPMPDLSDEMPPTPATAQPFSQISSEAPLKIEAYSVPAPAYNFYTQAPGINLYSDALLDPNKDDKLDNYPWSQMPDAVLPFMQ